MPHYPGHYPNGTLIINDVLAKTTFHVHGYLFVDKKGKDPKGNDIIDESIRILFLNNCGMRMHPPTGKPTGSLTNLPQPEIDKRKVGFNLLLIDMPTPGKGNKSKWGIAYNLFEWYHHENAEGSVQAIKRFMGRRVEDIAPSDLTDLCNRLEFKIKNPTAAEPDAKLLLDKLAGYTNQPTPPATALQILKQSAEYMTTESFKMSRAGDDPHQWIKENVADFIDMAPLFGSYLQTNP